MKTFKDTAGRTWELSLTLGSAITVKAATGADLLQPEAGDPPLLTRLGTDELFLGEVLCALLADQFQKHQLSAQQVQQAFDGPTLLAAQTAFYEELIDFFHSRRRPDRAKAVAKQQALIQQAIRSSETKIEALNLDQLLDDAQTPGKTSG